MEANKDIKEQNTNRSLSDNESEYLLKKVLRKEILKQRDLLSDSQHNSMSCEIRRYLQGWMHYKQSDVLLAFASFGSEVDTLTLIKEAIEHGKKVYCPRVFGDNMLFYKIEGLSDLIPGYRGILEPKDKLEVFCPDCFINKKILMLMPGTVFDLKRNRIGYGKGFYDRFLSQLQFGNACEFITAGLAFSLQIIEKVPAKKHDYQPDYLITEKGIYV